MEKYFLQFCFQNTVKMKDKWESVTKIYSAKENEEVNWTKSLLQGKKMYRVINNDHLYNTYWLLNCNY